MGTNVYPLSFFEQKQKLEKNEIFSSKNIFFYSQEKSQFIKYKVGKYRKILLIKIVYFIFSLVTYTIDLLQCTSELQTPVQTFPILATIHHDSSRF